MPVSSLRTAALLTVFVLFTLTSCSGPSSARVGSPEFYWSAAKETYMAGDYLKTADHLDHLIDSHNEFSARAIPWSLVLTSGIAAGYAELADSYTAGARVNKANALAFHRKATEYRTMAAPLVLRFGQNVEKLDEVPAGSIQLAFPLTNGTVAPPPPLGQIASGIELSPADADAAQALAIQRNVLLATCLAVGARNDTARAEEVLGHASAIIARGTFAGAMSQMLDSVSQIYTRDKLDDPAKLAILHQRSQNLANAAGQSGSAMLVKVSESGVR